MTDLKEALEKLHEATANELVDAITNGIPIRDDETGKVTRVKAPASYFAAAIALLKHNNIQCVPTKKNGMGKLAGAMANMPMPGEELRSVMDGQAE